MQPGIYIGCHLSVTDGYEAMGKTMLSFGGNTFAFFTRNPRGGKSKELLPEDSAALRELLRREGFGLLVAHGSYTMTALSSSVSVKSQMSIFWAIRSGLTDLGMMTTPRCTFQRRTT